MREGQRGVEPHPLALHLAVELAVKDQVVEHVVELVVVVDRARLHPRIVRVEAVLDVALRHDDITKKVLRLESNLVDLVSTVKHELRGSFLGGTLEHSPLHK